MIFNPVYGGASAPNLGTKTITTNGTYSASSDNLDGYSEVTANVPNSYTASDVGKVVQSVYGYIRTNNVALNITLSNWVYRASDKLEFEYKNVGSHGNLWGIFLYTVANTNALQIQYNMWSGRTCMNVRHNGTWSGDGNYSFDGPNNLTKYYQVTLDGSAFSIMSGSIKGTYGTTEVSTTIGTTSDTDTVNPVLFPTSSNNTLNVEFYGLRVYRSGTLIHNYQPTDGGVYDAVDGTTHLATASGGTYGGSTYALVAQTSKNISANDTYDTTLNDEIVVNVPNSYTASDEGKVVSNGALVAQTSATYSSNNTYDTTLINSVTVDVPSSGIQVITLSDWNALSTAQKQAYGLVAIQDADSGFDRGELVYGADYDPYKTAVHIWSKSIGGNDASMWVQVGTWDVGTNTFTATATEVGVLYSTVTGSNVYDCAGLVDLRYGRTSLNWDVYTKAVVIVDSVEYAVGVVAKSWRYNTSADFYVIAK